MNLVILFESDFYASNLVRLKDRRKEHIINVCRSKIGEQIRVGLFSGLMGQGTVLAITENYIELDVNLTDSPPAALPLTLILALPRPKSLKKSIEVATCLGIKKIIIIESWRVEKSYWTNPILNGENLLTHVILGLEQAKDTIPPKIEIRRFFKRFVEDEIKTVIQGTQALVGHPYSAVVCPHAVKVPVTLAIGPEGGFIPYEIELLEKQGFTAVSTGQRILRVEYAIAALSSRLFV